MPSLVPGQLFNRAGARFKCGLSARSISAASAAPSTSFRGHWLQVWAQMSVGPPLRLAGLALGSW